MGFAACPPPPTAVIAIAALLAVVAHPTSPAAQPVACAACTRGDEVIARFSLEPVRALASELATLVLADPLTPAQYAHVVALRRATPALVRLGAVDDDDLARIAAALCGAPTTACTETTARALRCLADRCAVALPDPDPQRDITAPTTCHRRVSPTRTTPIGLGLAWRTGWQRSAAPGDGAAWSLGIEARLRVGPRLGVVANVDRSAGRDEAIDLDGDGKDDHSTGSITRITALAGPSIALDVSSFAGSVRYVRLDVLAGYLATRSQPGEHGPAAGLDLAYQLGGFRVGVRVVQGFAGADGATMLLGHLGFAFGASPPRDEDVTCALETRGRPTRLALGFDVPFGGYGASSQLGYLATGLGIEALWYLSPSWDLVARGDVLVFPGGDRDRVLHHAALAGVRIDHGARGKRRSRTGWFTTVMAGYSHGAGVTPTTVGSGPIADLALGWGFQDREGGAFVRLHGRLGVSPDNLDYRAIWISGGFELRLEPDRWRRRIRP
jgi:hypothetical protein